MPTASFDEIMDFAPRNRNDFSELCELIRSRKIVPFIGAGMTEFCFPSWDDYLKEQFAKYLSGRDKPENPLDAASLLESELSRNDFLRDIMNAYGGADSFDWNGTLAKAKSEAITIFPSLFRGLLVTTNYDRMLENVYGSVPVAHPGNLEQLNRVRTQDGQLIFKVHGTVEDRSNMIITREDYEAFYGNGQTKHVETLKAVFSGSVLLFLGCRFVDDPAINLWMELSKGVAAGIEHFAIVGCKDGEQLLMRRELGTKNIRAILYDESKPSAVRVLLENAYIFGKPFGTLESSEEPPNNLPKRNLNFSGRHEQLEIIRKAFAGRSEKARTQTIWGLGGIGKTQIAKEYAYRHLDEYTDGVCWLDAENESSMLNSAFVFAQKVGFTGQAVADQLPAWLAGWLGGHEKSLAIFDNVEPEDVIDPYLPRVTSGNVLITTRKSNLSIGAIPIDTFTDEEARTILRERTGRKDNNYSEDHIEDSLAGIASRLRNLALALEQAAAYIANLNLKFSEFLDRLESDGLRPLENKYVKPSDYSRIVATAWNNSIAEVSKKDKAAMQLFFMLAYCDPSAIPLDLISMHRNVLLEPLQEKAATRMGMDEMVMLLREVSLIEVRENDTVEIHRLVQEVVRDQLGKNRDTHFLDMAFALMEAAVPRNYGSDSQDYALFRRVAAHASVVATYFLAAHDNNEELQKSAASLFERIGIGYEKATSQFEAALAMHKRSRTIRETVFGIEGADTASSYSNIANVYYSKGEYNMALEWHRKALDIREKALGIEHPDTASSYSNIAIVYNIMGEHLKALGLLEKALAIEKKKLGTNHTDTAAVYINIANVYHRMGKYSIALEWLDKALAIEETALSTDHPNKATTYSNIASAYFEMEDYDKALEWHEKALAIREKVLGTDHPDTAGTYNNIAKIYDRMGENDLAKKWIDKDLNISEKVLGTNHPHTATSYNILANVLCSMGEYNEAMKWLKKDQDISEKVLNADNPDIAATYSNIASVYESLGEYRQALEWYKKALVIHEKILGTDHPYTYTTYSNIANAYSHLGEFDTALDLYEKALLIHERLQSTTNLETATIHRNIGDMHYHLAEYGKALECYKKALAIREKALGTDHMVTATSYNDIAKVHHRMGEYDKALEWYIQSYRVLKHVSNQIAETARRVMMKAYKALSYTEPFETWLNRQLENTSSDVN